MQIGKGDVLTIDMNSAAGTNGVGGAEDTPLIELRDVVFSYTGHTVVDGVSLQVDRGELVALLGPNGCGKTTIMRLINGDAQLFCATVGEEVAFGPAQMGLPADELERRVSDAMGLFQVADLADASPYQLSGGQKKRVALAAVVSMNPDILVLDEPTNGLCCCRQDGLDEHTSSGFGAAPGCPRHLYRSISPCGRGAGVVVWNRERRCGIVAA